MFKIFLFVVLLGTTLADYDFDDRFDDSREIHFVRGSPTLKAVGVPLPYTLFKSAPVTKTGAVEPLVKTASDVEVVHVDQRVQPNAQTPPKVETPEVNFRGPFIVKIDDDDDDDRVYFRNAGPAAVPLTYSSGPYRFKFDFDDDDDDDDDHKVVFRNANPRFRNAFIRYDDDDDDDRKFFFRSSVGVPLPATYGDDKVLVKSAVNTAPKFVAAYKIDDDDDDDDDRRFFFRTAGNPSPIPYAARYKYDDDLFDFDDK